MMTSASGRSATIASAVCRMRLSSVGRRAITGNSPMTAMSLDREQAFQTLGLHRLAADAEERDARRMGLAERAHQLEAELVAGMLARDQRDAQPAAALDVHAGNPTMNRPAASASRMQRSRSTMRTAPGRQREPAQLGARRARDRVGADRRHVEPQVLPALRRLDQHARRPLVPQPAALPHLGDASEHRVGALGRLDRQHPVPATTAHCPASKSDSAQEEPRAEGDVGFVLGRRAAPGEPAFRRDQPRRNLVRADDAHAFALEDLGEADKQAVVAAPEELRKLGGALDRAPVEPQVREFRASHRADHGQLGDAAAFQRGEQLADLAEPDPDVRVGLDRRRRTRR